MTIFFHGSVMDGLVLTRWLTAAVITRGIGLAAMRLSSNHILRTLSFGYVWLGPDLPRPGQRQGRPVLRPHAEPEVRRGPHRRDQVPGPDQLHPVGFVTAKGSPIAKALSDAVNELITNGVYAKTFGKWGVAGTDEIAKSALNPAPAFSSAQVRHYV